LLFCASAIRKTLPQQSKSFGHVINFPIRNALGHRLASIASDFDPCTYGYRKLSDLVRKTGAFEVD
jgi:hypothetical protein